jgi:phosphopantetheinyl transferase
MKTASLSCPQTEFHIQLCAADEITLLQESGELSDWLASSEREMVARLRSAKRRKDWLAGRLAAKRAIARYLEEVHRLSVPTAQIVIGYDEQGRPRPRLLSTNTVAEDLSLSLAHCDGWGLAAVADRPRVGHIGVDLQRIRPVRPALVERILTASECMQLSERFAGREIEGFFIYWTLKEAALKALGSDLRLPMRALDIQLAEQVGRAKLPIRLSSGWSIAEAHYWMEPIGFQAAYVQFKDSASDVPVTSSVGAEREDLRGDSKRNDDPETDIE